MPAGHPGDGLLRSRSWPLLDPGREQVYYLSDARRPQAWPAGRRIDPAQVGLAVELRQRAEERRGGRAGLERSGDVIGKIAALRAFRRQLNDHIVAYCDTRIAQPRRAHAERPSAAARRNPPADPPAVDRAAYGMPSFATPRLVWVKRNHDNRAATRTSSDVGTEPLNAQGLIVAR
jgi:hypothetical protein